MDALETFLARQACAELVLRAARHADAHEPALLAALFTQDGVLVRPSAEPLHGREAIRQAYARRPADRLTRHLVTNTLVELESPAQARARSCVLLWAGSTLDEAGPFGRPAQGAQLVGEFDDRFTLTPEGWRIARREARFVLHAGD